MKQNIINIKNLTVKFGDFTVLDNIDLSIPKNAITVILGESGCGKSTLLKSIIGLQPIHEGEIRIFDKDIHDENFSKELEKLGMVFQNGALLNSVSVYENIKIPLRQHTDLPDEIIDKVIKAKLHQVNLSHAMNYLPSELSGGMKKRAAFARAIALDPQLLFCDEPSAGLDPNTRYALDNLLLELQNQLKMTMLLVTHEISTVRRIADKLIFLHQGRIIFKGSFESAQESDNKLIKNFFSKA